MTPARLREHVVALAFISAISPVAGGTSLGSLAADRAAVERVYYNHRLGTKPPFEELLPPAEVEKLVRLDLKKELILKRRYGTEITAADVQAEIDRINATSRAPDILAEIKAALGDDPDRFAAIVARPAIVERQLRSRFDNDEELHAAQRKRAEELRRKLLATKRVQDRVALLRSAENCDFSEATWQLASRSAAPEKASPSPQVTTRSASYSIEATAERSLAVPEPADVSLPRFDEVDPELQPILRTQLRKAGDVSAVIETPAAFLLFVAQEKSPAVLRVATATFPKQDFHQWLAEQPD